MHFHDFAWALKQLTSGEYISRKTWKRKGYLRLHVPDARSKMTLPYIYFTSAEDGYYDHRPYTPSQEDLLSGDWGIE